MARCEPAKSVQRQMGVPGLILRTLRHNWRLNLAVVLGAFAGTASLTGALLVGDAMRSSLLRKALERLGPVDHALVSGRFIREELANGPADQEGVRGAPAILIHGSATRVSSRSTASRVRIWGVDDKFHRLFEPATSDQSLDGGPSWARSGGVAVNEELARELGVQLKDEVILRFENQSRIPAETLLGRRTEAPRSLRLSVQAILPNDERGGLGLDPSVITPKNAFVPLSLLQRILDRPGRANVILVATAQHQHAGAEGRKRIQDHLIAQARLSDYDLKIRVSDELGYLALESDRFLLEPGIESAARSAAAAIGLEPMGVLAYLATSISSRGAEAIPYSTVAGFDVLPIGAEPWRLRGNGSIRSIPEGEALLSEWAVGQLGARPSDGLDLEFQLTDESGVLSSRVAAFRIMGEVEPTPAMLDPRFVPEYPGVTDVRSLADWDPPFPMDLKRIRKQDEVYWETHRTAPKVFVSLADAQRLWAGEGERFGRLTSLRMYPPHDRNKGETAEAFQTELLRRLDPARFDMRFRSVRQEAVEASKGTTDFGGLFLGFSFFLIAAATLLVALLFQLQVERRSSELALLLALGFTRRRISTLVFLEGGSLSLLGSLAGVAGSVLYAAAMLTGLRSSWSEAVRAPFLAIDVSWTSLGIGWVAGMTVALISIMIAVRRLTRVALQESGTATLIRSMGVEIHGPRRKIYVTSIGWSALGLALVFAVLPRWTEAVSPTVSFFLSGTSALVAALSLARSWFHRPDQGLLSKPGWAAVLRLGIRNARRSPARSLLVISLLASTTFLITAIEAFRIDPGSLESGRTSGTGGFRWIAESTLPLLHDPNVPQGRDALGMDEEATSVLNSLSVMPFRLRSGDETSCRSLYRPQNPRIVGVSNRMIQRGGFTFADSLDPTPQERENPWSLLSRELPDGAIPAIGDEAAVRWQLHSGLGKDFEVHDEGGRPMRLRFVALLRGSMLQSELLISEASFKRLFPNSVGHSFFLIEDRGLQAHDAGAVLERSLSDYGIDVTDASHRLADFLGVQNTYLTTFQSLGGMGLVLGAFGLAAVLLRSAWERRSESALLAALGFSRASVLGMVMVEHGFLVVGGMVAGLVPATLAVAPQLAVRAADLPWVSLAWTLSGVVVVGVGAGFVALLLSLRAPLLPSLRGE